MTHTPFAPEQLAAAVASRLIHDAMGPASGIVSAFDLLADPAAASMRAEALELAASSARALVAQLKVSRIIYASGEAAVGVGETREMAAALFVGSRARLRLAIPPEASPAAMRALLGLLRIAADGAGAGGEVSATLSRATQEEEALVEAAGPRVRIDAETLAGLSGREAPGGLATRWATGYFLFAAIGAAGGSLDVRPSDEGVAFRAAFPR